MENPHRWHIEFYKEDSGKWAIKIKCVRCHLRGGPQFFVDYATASWDVGQMLEKPPFECTTPPQPGSPLASPAVQD